MFIEEPRFIEDIIYGSSGGPSYNTKVVAVQSGFEKRNSNWESARHKYNAAFGIQTDEQLQDLAEFFHVVQGRAHGFRYKDHLDFQCTMNILVDNDDFDLNLPFQLEKIYKIGAHVSRREINKPVQGSMVVTVDGVLKSESIDYQVFYETGIFYFLETPEDESIVTIDFEFDVPCRFDTDSLDMSLNSYNNGSANIPIVEIRVKTY